MSEKPLVRVSAFGVMGGLEPNESPTRTAEVMTKTETEERGQKEIGPLTWEEETMQAINDYGLRCSQTALAIEHVNDVSGALMREMSAFRRAMKLVHQRREG